MPADRCEQSERRLVEARGFPTGSCGEPLEGETLAGFQDQCIQPDSATPPLRIHYLHLSLPIVYLLSTTIDR